MEKYPEIRELLELLIGEGFIIDGYQDEDVLVSTCDIDEIVNVVHGVEECWVDVSRNGIYSGLFFVIGNEQGVALNDYTCEPLNLPFIETASEMMYKKYN